MSCSPGCAEPGYEVAFVRHNLGLYDAILAGVILLITIRMRNVRGRGVATGVAFVIYGTVRFFFDYLRVNDATYLGLTPAQYMCFPLILAGIVFVVWGRREVAAGYDPYPDAPKPDTPAPDAPAA